MHSSRDPLWKRELDSLTQRCPVTSNSPFGLKARIPILAESGAVVALSQNLRPREPEDAGQESDCGRLLLRNALGSWEHQSFEVPLPFNNEVPVLRRLPDGVAKHSGCGCDARFTGSTAEAGFCLNNSAELSPSGASFANNFLGPYYPALHVLSSGWRVRAEPLARRVHWVCVCGLEQGVASVAVG